MTSLQEREVLRVLDGKGSQLRVLDGCIWVTQENDVTDHVIPAGCSFRIERPGVTLVSGLRPSTLEVRQPASTASLPFAAAA
jgi:hypothetical protein